MFSSFHRTTLCAAGTVVLFIASAAPGQASDRTPDIHATVGLAVDGGRLVVEPTPRPRYSLDELLALPKDDCKNRCAEQQRDQTTLI